MVPDILLHNYTNSTNSTQCFKHEAVNQAFFTFDAYQLGRVIVTWILFALSVTGNIFVLVSLRAQKERWTSNVIVMFNVALADLLYACTVLPIDGVWNMTMQWYGGDGLCRITQMLKQIGMYASANMVMVIGINRAWTLARSLRESTKHSKILVRAAWVMSVICSVPAGIFFSVCQIVTCEGTVLTQCVDNVALPLKYLHPYHFFTMVMSFILPVIVTIISGLVIVNAITLMNRNRPSLRSSKQDLNKAINITASMKTLITVSFLVCWTPYYAIGIIYWFGLEIDLSETSMLIYRIPYMMMYLNCFLHPIIFGLYTKNVKQNFVACLYPIKKRMRFTNISTSRISKQDHAMTPTPISHYKNSISNDQTKLMTTDEQFI